MIASLGLTSFIFQISATIVKLHRTTCFVHTGHNPFMVVISRLRLGSREQNLRYIHCSCNWVEIKEHKPILGFNYGAKKYSRVHETMNLLLKVTLILSTVFMDSIRRLFRCNSFKCLEAGMLFIMNLEFDMRVHSYSLRLLMGLPLL